MTLTIELGWWLLPAAITLVAFAIAWASQVQSDGRDYGAGAVFSLMFFMLAAVVSLASWLAWAVLS